MERDASKSRIRFIADDFGLSEAVNAAILRAHLEGTLHGACLMMGQPGTAQAIEMARSHPSLEIGWHVHLCDSQPTTIDAWPWGASPARAGLTITTLSRARALVRAEISTQWALLSRTGLSIATVNAHHHLHWHPFVHRILVSLLKSDESFHGWLRWGKPRFFGTNSSPIGYRLVDLLLQAPKRAEPGIRRSDTLWGIDRTFAMSPAEIIAAMSTLDPGLHEFMFHPRPGLRDSDTECLIALKTEIANLPASHLASGSETCQS